MDANQNFDQSPVLVVTDRLAALRNTIRKIPEEKFPDVLQGLPAGCIPEPPGGLCPVSSRMPNSCPRLVDGPGLDPTVHNRRLRRYRRRMAAKVAKTKGVAQLSGPKVVPEDPERNTLLHSSTSKAADEECSEVHGRLPEGSRPGPPESFSPTPSGVPKSCPRPLDLPEELDPVEHARFLRDYRRRMAARMTRSSHRRRRIDNLADAFSNVTLGK